MTVLRQIIRGCGTLPHVGEHPGTVLVVFIVVLGVVAGGRGGWLGALLGGVLMLGVFGPMYLWGAYDRANISDRMSSHELSPSDEEKTR